MHFVLLFYCLQLIKKLVNLHFLFLLCTKQGNDYSSTTTYHQNWLSNNVLKNCLDIHRFFFVFIEFVYSKQQTQTAIVLPESVLCLEKIRKIVVLFLWNKSALINRKVSIGAVVLLRCFLEHQILELYFLEMQHRRSSVFGLFRLSS